ncbi:MAG: hypothetical protein CM1200mP36_08910 [Gammaproteobacteria bacterium]|nr:MAG: hypothetical protein CM1200mP36_08910 [Gammaproteobacteria bacterium]
MGYHFPESVASHQEALRHDPDHPMIYWGLALALGPVPNSRSAGLPDDPQGEAREAIEQAMEFIGNGTEVEQAFVRALYIRFDSDTYPDRDARIKRIWPQPGTCSRHTRTTPRRACY